MVIAVFLLLTIIYNVNSISYDRLTYNEDEKTEFCSTLYCKHKSPENERVCGIKLEGEGFRVRLFDNECKLLQYDCQHNETYGITEKHYCDSLDTKDPIKVRSDEPTYDEDIPIRWCDTDCPEEDTKPSCGIRQEGNGFRVKLFPNKCFLQLYNCANNTDYIETDDIDCEDLNPADEEPDQLLQTVNQPADKIENIVVIRGIPFHKNRSVNDTIEDFFAATHSVRLPIRPLPLYEQTRRTYHFKKAAPIVIFEPWIKIPKNRSDDYDHVPTVSSCYHKCPKECPDMYKPVCGVPGIIAKEPTLVFQNHCYMDMAQCKMFREDMSATAQSSNYVESSFLFCVGDEMFGLFRFVPLIRTLQRMGRLKQKGKFKYKFNNFKFQNNRLLRNPNLMG